MVFTIVDFVIFSMWKKKVLKSFATELVSAGVEEKVNPEMATESRRVVEVQTPGHGSESVDDSVKEDLLTIITAQDYENGQIKSKVWKQRTWIKIVTVKVMLKILVMVFVG